jgi:hypothetical protein
MGHPRGLTIWGNRMTVRLRTADSLAGMTERKAKAKTSVEMTVFTESVRNPG